MDFALPEIGEGVYEAELVRWLVKPGDVVKRGQTLLEVMTDKATMEVPAPNPGVVGTLIAQIGQPIKVGQVVLRFAGQDQPAPVAEPLMVSAALPVSAAAPVLETDRRARNGNRPSLPAKASPSVRLLARQLGLDLEHIDGSGPGGRVLVEDLRAFVRPAISETVVKRAVAEAQPDYGKPGTRIPLIGLRRKIAEHMERSCRLIPHYGYVDECDVTDLVRLRLRLKDVYGRAGIKLTYLAFFVRAVVAALKAVPLVNASLDETSGSIVLHDKYNIGIAVMTTNGLIVPVVRDADQKDLGTIAREIDRLSRDARAGKARLEDVRGGTFTISSVGSIGGLFSTPVINHPEVGILGLAKVVRRPVFDDKGQVVPADLMYLSFSFDHRVVDGAVGAAFANAIIAQISNPAALLLPEKL
jgi:pyruvate dehydrogenase E2 component (dihydrolipoamide acetyltransferase)/2-oxoisovalerate dehydrogenase E2 component (dihydrolipoyl transacylase)